MKRILLIVAILICIGANAQKDDKHKNLGLVAHLVFIKLNAEQKFVTAMSDTVFVKNKINVDDITRKYNSLKIEVDQFILQLIADSKQKNRVRRYRKVNKYIRGLDKLSAFPQYREVLISIDNDYKDLIDTKITEREAIADEIVLAIGEKVVDIILANREFREKKVAGLSEILIELRLQSVGELAVDRKDEKGEKKSDKKKKQ